MAVIISRRSSYCPNLATTPDETSKNLTEGGYGFVRGEAICDPTTSGHDYRIDGEIFAGKHHDLGISKEVHLPCNVN